MSPPESKWITPAEGNDLTGARLSQASDDGITLTVHSVVLLGDQATLYLSTATTDSGQLGQRVVGADRRTALPQSARLGARGKSDGPDTSPARNLVELARLDNVVLAAATFDLPRVTPQELNLEVPAMRMQGDNQTSGLVRGTWSIEVLQARHPELPDRNHYSVYPLGPETISYGAVSVSRGDGQGRGVTRPGILASAEHVVLDRGDLAAFRLQSSTQTMPVYAVRHMDGRVEPVSVETYQAWVEPTLPGYQEKPQPAPTGTPHMDVTPLSPDQERIMQATRESAGKRPTQTIQDLIKQFPPQEQTPVPPLNPPTRVPPRP